MISRAALTDADRRRSLAWAALASVEDPEIPALSIVDLGLIRFVELRPDGSARSGPVSDLCRLPGHRGDSALRGRRTEKRRRRRLRRDHGVVAAPGAAIGSRAEGRRKLAIYGIVPPEQSVVVHAGCVAGRPARGLSPLPLDRHRMHQRIRLDAVQGAASLPRLPRTLRILQMHLTDVDLAHA